MYVCVCKFHEQLCLKITSSVSNNSLNHHISFIPQLLETHTKTMSTYNCHYIIFGTQLFLITKKKKKKSK